MAAHDPEKGLAVAAALLPFWRERGHHAEAQRRCVQLLDHPANQAPSEARARVRIALCGVANERNQTALIRPLAGAVLADAQALGDPGLEALGWIWLAHADEADDDLAAAIGHYHQALVLLRRQGDRVRVAETLTNLACILIEQGRVAEAGPLLGEALGLYRAADNLWGQGFVQSTMSEAARAGGDPATALDHARQGLALHRQLQHQHRLSHSLLQCGQLLLQLGRSEQARAPLAEALAIVRAHEFGEQATLVLVQSALLAAAEGRPQQAATLLGAAQASVDRGGALVSPADHAEFARARERVQSLLAAPDWEARWDAGLGLSLAAAGSIVLSAPGLAADA